MTTDDRELAAMETVRKTVEELDEEARQRVLVWAVHRFRIKTKGAQIEGEDSEYKEFADLFDAANPKTTAQRALVGGYWFQLVNGRPTFTGQEVNKELKHVGQEVGNITDAFTALIGEKPSLALQVRKGGRTKQARKQYKLTTEGIKRVRGMISGQGGNAAS